MFIKILLIGFTICLVTSILVFVLALTFRKLKEGKHRKERLKLIREVRNQPRYRIKITLKSGGVLYTSIFHHRVDEFDLVVTSYERAWSAYYSLGTTQSFFIKNKVYAVGDIHYIEIVRSNTDHIISIRYKLNKEK